MEKKEYIIDKALELAKEIRQSKEYQMYLNASIMVEENKYIQSLIEQIILLQKDLVHIKYLNIDITKEEIKLKKLKDKLYQNTIYKNYLNKIKVMDELNRKIEKEIMTKLNIN